MSMIGHLRMLSADELASVQRDPATVKALQGSERGQTLRNIAALTANFTTLRATIKELHSQDPSQGATYRDKVEREMRKAGISFDEPETVLSLEKSWHVLHYLLTGRAGEAPPPLGNAILGGAPIGADQGYGPARVLSAEQVREVADALSALRADDLDRHANLGVMKAADIYACREKEDVDLGRAYFAELRDFYREAASANAGMLLDVS